MDRKEILFFAKLLNIWLVFWFTCYCQPAIKSVASQYVDPSTSYVYIIDYNMLPLVCNGEWIIIKLIFERNHL